jgi:hypothetical protein
LAQEDGDIWRTAGSGAVGRLTAAAVAFAAAAVGRLSWPFVRDPLRGVSAHERCKSKLAAWWLFVGVDGEFGES